MFFFENNTRSSMNDTVKADMESTQQTEHVRFNLTLVRHAETHANSEGIIQGIIDTELSNIGYIQSKALGQHLKYHRFSHIYSSDLKRAAETARIIRSLNHLSSCQVQHDSLLRERMYGVAQGKTREWLHELAKKSGVPYMNFTPPNAETPDQVRERVIRFFQKLCHDLLQQARSNSLMFLSKQSSPCHALPSKDIKRNLLHSISSENLTSLKPRKTNHFTRKRSLSTGNVEVTLIENNLKTTSCQSSVDSALELSLISSDQQSMLSSTSYLSRNSSFEKPRTILKCLSHSPYQNDHSDLDVLVVSHGGVIREFIKYFVYDLQTDIGQHLPSIQHIAPNTSITRFKVLYSTNEYKHPITTLGLVDYHNKAHLIQTDHDEYNLDVINKCSL